MAKRLNGEEVNGIGEGLAVELLVVEGGSRAHGVDEDDGGFCGVNAVIGKAVTNVDAAEVGHFDGGFGGHVWLILFRVLGNGFCWVLIFAELT